VLDVVTDATWTATVNKAQEAQPAVELGGIELSPWRLGEHFLDVAGATRDQLPVERAALVAADPLMTALGRPNREQVVTVRQSTATTLQVLELTNGGTLAALLKEGADRRFVQSPLNPSGLIDVVLPPGGRAARRHRQRSPPSPPAIVGVPRPGAKASRTSSGR
jgi:hypothetical protein